jgi:protein tyrosine phosphatase
MLTCITGDTANGMLVHCISGWDRTPLFISLMRVSLWADGVIHKSLDAAQVNIYVKYCRLISAEGSL